MTVRPRLYIDVDGVLFGFYRGHVQLRPDVLGFLRWCLARFDCFWLTRWSYPHLVGMLSSIQGADVARAIQDTAYTENKAHAIDDIADGDFFWIEDAILLEERAVLAAAGKLDRYIEVRYEGQDELDRVRGVLEATMLARMGAEQADMAQAEPEKG